jgi:glyoxylase-like metal-dependent hydrolase (beta-lactamase superfamily II)
MNSQSQTFDSPHFNLEEIASGVFAAIHKPGGGAIANAGIVDLGDQTLVFDTFISHIAALDLRLAAKQFTGKPVTHVINSHFHNDHIRGNQVFPGAKIIATNQTVDLIKTDGERELAWDKNAEKRYEELRLQREEAKNGDPDPNLDFFINYYRVISESLPGLRMRMPDTTFDQQLAFEGSARKVELHCYGGGHTGSDAILYLPEDHIAFVADLLFVRCHPFLADGDPQEWLDHIDKIKKLDIEIVVPGHGAVGVLSDLDLIQQYIRSSVQMIDTAFADGDSLEAVEKKEVPPQYRDWEFESFFYSNLRFLYSQHTPNSQADWRRL